MAESWKAEKWAQAEDFWYSGKTTRRRFIGFGAAAVLVTSDTFAARHGPKVDAELFRSASEIELTILGQG